MDNVSDNDWREEQRRETALYHAIELAKVLEEKQFYKVIAMAEIVDSFLEGDDTVIASFLKEAFEE